MPRPFAIACGYPDDSQVTVLRLGGVRMPFLLWLQNLRELHPLLA